MAVDRLPTAIGAVIVADVFRRVRRGLREALEQAPWISARSDWASATTSSSVPLTKSNNAASTNYESFSYEKSLLQEDPTYIQFKQKGDWHSLYKPLDRRESLQANQSDSNSDIQSSVTNSYGSHEASFNSKNDSEIALSTNLTNNLSSAETNASVSSSYWSSLQVLGQADLTYIITQRADALVFVDQHAAHERVLFEALSKRWNGAGIEIQNYLIPLRISLDSHLIEALFTQAEDVKAFGFEMDRSGPDVIEILSHPFGVKEKAVSTISEDVSP